MSMLLPNFELHLPETIEGVTALLKQHGPENCDILAGGSDLLCNYKQWLNTKPHVIGLKHVAALRTIEPGRIGAGVKLRELVESEVVSNTWPVIGEVARKIASVLIQEQATLGGNLLLDTRCHFFNQSYFWRRSLGYCLKAEGDLCHVIPKIKRDGVLVDNRFECVATNSSDMLPVIIALGGELELAGVNGHRLVKAGEFFRHDGIARFHKDPGELLVAVRLPAASKGVRAGYKKLRPREAWDFPVLGVAAALRTGRGGVVESLTLCVNAVDTHPIRFDDEAAKYVGKTLGEREIAAIAEHVQKTVQPKLNVPMEPGYRKKMAGVFTKRLLTELAANGN